MDLAASLKGSDRTLGALWHIYAGSLTSTGPRSQPVAWYAALAFEHMEAMIVLVERRLFGSALTLVRPIFEATCRAGWVMGCANDDQIEEMRHNDRFPYPPMKAMATAVDTRFNLEGLFTRSVEGEWAAMNSYAHPGLRQLTKRFTESAVEPEYPEELIVRALSSSLNWVLLLAVLVLRNHGREADAQRVEHLMIHGVDSRQ